MFKRELIVELKAAGYRPRAWVPYVRGHVNLALHTLMARPEPARSVVAHGAALCALLFAGSLVLALTDGLELGRRLFLSSALWIGALTAWVLMHLGLLTDLAGGGLVGRGGASNRLARRGSTRRRDHAQSFLYIIASRPICDHASVGGEEVTLAFPTRRP